MMPNDAGFAHWSRIPTVPARLEGKVCQKMKRLFLRRPISKLTFPCPWEKSSDFK